MKRESTIRNMINNDENRRLWAQDGNITDINARRGAWRGGSLRNIPNNDRMAGMGHHYAQKGCPKGIQ